MCGSFFHITRLSVPFLSCFYLFILISQIRTLAARAAASFVLSNESNTALLKHFADLLPGILQVSYNTLVCLCDFQTGSLCTVDTEPVSTYVFAPVMASEH